jgi:hypothetical protein
MSLVDELAASFRGNRNGAELEQRLAALESAVAGLQAQPVADQLSPNYLTMTSGGQVGANFSGVINALGVTLPAGTVKAANNEVAWKRTSDGAAVADIYGVSGGAGISTLNLEAAPIDGGSETTQISLTARSGLSSINLGFAPGSVGGVLLNAAGQSMFPQLTSAHELMVDDNGGAFYTFAVPAIPAGGVSAFAFNTNTLSWGGAFPVGAVFSMYCLWQYAFTPPNGFTIRIGNPFGSAQGPGNWIGFVVGL